MRNFVSLIILLLTKMESKRLNAPKVMRKKIVKNTKVNKVKVDQSQEYLFGIGNPLASMLRTGAMLRDGGVLNTTSPIAAITVPDIAPILQLITDAATEIYQQIQTLIQATKTQIDTDIDNIFVAAIPDIQSIVVSGNSSIKNAVNTAFNTATTNFTAVYNTVNVQELADATSNIIGPNATMLAQILDVLNNTQTLIDNNISTGLDASIQAITDALTSANNAIYTQIETLLADPNNTASIASQLVYVDPATITAVLVNTNQGIYGFINTALADALTQIQSIINTQSGISLAQQETTLNTANQTLFASLTTEVDAALVSIQNSINTVTASEVSDISTIINGLETDILNSLSTSISSLDADVTNIINTITQSTVNQTTSLIQTNNSLILSLVVQILAAAI